MIKRLICPPAELVQSWQNEWRNNNGADRELLTYVAAMAATWGATNAIEMALRDTSSCHWRVADGQEEGAQLVRASDLMAWSQKLGSRYQPESDQ